MAISKIKITNFKCFKNTFEFKLNKKLNILVGNNDSGKSTILEAIHMALTSLYGGRNIRNELTQYIFNDEIVSEYIKSVNSGKSISPPSVIIEVFFDGTIDPTFEGNSNSDGINGIEGLKFEISYNSKFDDEYHNLIKKKSMQSLPIEYYDVSWTTFARTVITVRSIPLKSAMIDSSNHKFQNGSDVYISRIVKDLLTPEEITSVAQAHRNMKERFIDDESIVSINERIQKESSIIDGKVSLSVDLGTKSAWENSLVTQLNDIPFGYIGKGSQCIVKTELALTHKRSQSAQIILLEEPESHLSYSKLSQLINAIESKYEDKQIIISTHNSFVANKLGLEHLMLLNNHEIIKFDELPSASFFKKIAGYDTLRLVLSKKSILVEGDSDELVVQKAYMMAHDGKLPIHDGVDVISVGTSFLRFLEIAEKLNINVSVVTDTDFDIKVLEKKYDGYLGDNKKSNIKICYDTEVDSGTLKIGDKNFNYNTLEPKLLKCNNLKLLNEIFDTSYNSDDEMHKYMKNNKTECALKIFDTDKAIVIPSYILEAIADE
ncbi:MAG: AAA family ATPase [Paludibacter sp.]|nr:AAA family ATPase [Paludibacter sp.]